MINIVSYLKKVQRRFDLASFSALIAFVVLSLTIASTATPIDGESELYSNIIRFHVLANSDSQADQQLKLKVRDSITEYTTELLSDCRDIESAKRLISENKDRICEIAQRCVYDNGYSYNVSTSTGNEIYPRRIYGKYTFPAGEYFSFKVNIGKAEGKNWWCVLFPPMCQSGALVEKYDNPKELSDIGFSQDEINVISENGNVKKEIRFFFLDFLNSLK